MKKSELIVNKGPITTQYTKNIRPILPKDPSRKCFVCDHCVGTQSVPLLKANTPYSKISLPSKIGELMGDDFIVLVSIEDSVCLKCVDLFRNLDHLEEEVEKLKSTIIKFLKTKYHISDEHLHINGPSVNIEKIPADHMKRKYDEMKEKNPNREDIEQQLSNMFGAPIQIMTTNTKRKVLPYFKCASCNFQTDNLSELSSHHEKCKHNMTVQLKCSKCKIKFDDQKILNKHMREAHMVNYKCSICNISFTSEGVLKSHIARKGCQRFICSTCDFRTGDKQKYDEHERTHVKKMFKCGICSQRFESKSHLNVHLKKHKAAYFKCGICSETFQKRDVLMKHLSSHSRPKLPSVENSEKSDGGTTTQSLLRASIEEALRVDPEPEKKSKDETKRIEFFTCATCQLTFINESMYSQHMKTHENQTRSDKNEKEDITETSDDVIDLESIFEKLHSDDPKKKDEEIELEKNGINDAVSSQSSNVPSDVLIYRCGACEEIFNDASHLQIHLLTSGHGDIDSEIQILEIPDGSRLVENGENRTMIIQTEENGEIKLLSIDADTKLISNGENVLSVDSRLEIDGIEFIRAEENGEIKLLTTDGEVKFLSMNENDEGNTFLETEFTGQATSSALIFEQKSNDAVATATESLNVETSDNSIQELLQCVGVDSNANDSSENQIDRSSDRFFMETNDSVNKKIELPRQILENSKDDEHDFNLDELCSTTIKSEMQSQNQVSIV